MKKQLYLQNKIVKIKNNKPIKVNSDQTEILSRIQAKVLILTVQP